MAHDPLTAMVKDGHLLWLGQGKEALSSYLAKMEGKTISITVDSAEPKTQSQLAYYYVVIVPIVRARLIDDGHEVMGVPVDDDFTDKVIKYHCAKFGGKKVIPKRNMSKARASEFIDIVIRWVNITFGIDIPQPPDKIK
jgi:hypothetical protein